MFGDKSQRAMHSIIGVDCHIEGNVTFGGGLRVDGRIRGQVQSDASNSGYVIVSSSGCIEGNVRAESIWVAGQIVGDVQVQDALELQSRSRVIGDVRYRKLMMQPGAIVSGTLRHQVMQEEPSASGLVLKLA